MTKTIILAAAAALFTGFLAPAQAAFYFEGLMPYTDPPNCNDPYATSCGRYGQVPHEKKPSVRPQARPDARTGVGSPQGAMPSETPAPGIRYDTRDGLEK